jgi:hypothetical protein
MYTNRVVKDGQTHPNVWKYEIASIDCYYTMMKINHCTGLTVVLTKIFRWGFEHIKVNVQNLIFFYFTECSFVV